MHRSWSSWCLRAITGLVCGLFVGELNAAWATDNLVYEEVCSCSCGPWRVNVRPSTRPPNDANCRAMSGKVCDTTSQTPNKLSCGGNTVVVQVRKGVNTPGTLPGTLDPGPRTPPKDPFSRPGMNAPILKRGSEPPAGGAGQ